MDKFFDFGIQIILFLQSIGEWIIPPMKAVSFTGVEEFYLVVLPAVYWCIDNAFGLRLGLIVMISGAFNDSFKVLFHTPRPFWYSSDIKAYVHEYQFGNPSGHAQNAVAFWGYLATYFKKRWFWISAILLMFLIGLSRLVLGMHFHIDVLSGWIIGIILLWAFIRFSPSISNWMGQKKLTFQLAAVFISSLAFLGFYALSVASLRSWQLPQEWVANAIAALPEVPSSPLTYKGIVSKIGVLFGLGAGAALIQNRGGFSVKGTRTQKITRYFLGLLITVIIWVGLDFVFPEGETLIPLIFRYIRYGLTGFWVSGGAPLLFKRIQPG